ncbi:transmembrane and ubiquitin-like domain-containing protein 1 [Cimex lectularius]|uniref:Ubiquitin-like domain-containing protein n=1 Tax=Cimex lectularius TaxID=79782 RepID=A0A8I6RGZ2_CIMLE|nr:transmembrane and ubiquitin-like domain-containing protein 1 [Cimex lectularius]
MPLIEGIGDEVVQFFGVLLAAVLGIFAWWSTNISDIPRIRTVLVLGRRAQPPPERVTEVAAPQVATTDDEVNKESSKESKLFSEPKEARSGSDTQDAEDGQRPDEDPDRPLDDRPSDESRSENPPDIQPPGNIRIRLKYLNDEQKLVEGKLQELLGDFKRRNFHAEISRQQRIRLIFNGHVLQSDDRTLQGCGLFDNCVVHCLVHNQTNANTNNSQSHAHRASPEWNLGGLLYALLSLIFGIAWFCRLQYSHLFNIITTGTLVGLTIMFAASVIGLYMPDHELVQQ